MNSLGKYCGVGLVIVLGTGRLNAQSSDGDLAAQLSAATKSLENATQILATHKDDISKLQIEIEGLKKSLNANPIVARVIPEEGAVIAFDRPNGCPDGWSLFTEAADRFVIGVGDKYELPYVAGQPKYQTGGSERHTLSVDEMPTHKHGIRYLGSDYAVAHPGPGQSVGVTKTIGSANTNGTGKGDPHNNMPPYIALYICKKDAP